MEGKHNKDNAPQPIGRYEGESYRPYAELGEGKDFDSWGSVLVTNKDGVKEWRSFYNDSVVNSRLFCDNTIRDIKLGSTYKLVLTDFGGGDGIALEQVSNEFSKAGINVEPILLDMDQNKLQKAKIERSGIDPIVGDLTKIPLADNSVDMGMSRMAMQYLPRPFDRDEPLPEWLPENNIVVREKFEKDGYTNQFDVLKEMFRVLRPGSSLVLVWPGHYAYGNETERVSADNISYFWNRITATKELADDDAGRIMDENFESLERWFTSGEEMARFAKKAGFDLVEGEEIDWVEFNMTAKSVLSRFDPKEKWLADVRQYIDEDFENIDKKPDQHTMGLNVKKWHDKNAVRIPICRLVLRKPK